MGKVTAVLMRLLLTVPLSWVAYWILMPAFICLRRHEMTAHCLSGIPFLVASAVALPMFADTFAGSDDPLVDIFLPFVILALTSAVVWAWISGEFKGRGPT
jgi:hypothetical protein